MNDIETLLSYMIAKEATQPTQPESLNTVLNELSDASIWNLIEIPHTTSDLKEACKSILKNRILAKSN